MQNSPHSRRKSLFARLVLILVTMASSVLIGGTAGAADKDVPKPTPPGQPPGRDKAQIDKRSVIVPSQEAQAQSDKPERKGRPDKTQPSGDIKELIRQFQSQREDYLKEQHALHQQLKTASDEQRAAIREQMKESLERWKEQQRALMQEQKDRAKEMKTELQKDLGRIVDEARGEGGR